MTMTTTTSHATLTNSRSHHRSSAVGKTEAQPYPTTRTNPKTEDTLAGSGLRGRSLAELGWTCGTIHRLDNSRGGWCAQEHGLLPRCGVPRFIPLTGLGNEGVKTRTLLRNCAKGRGLYRKPVCEQAFSLPLARTAAVTGWYT